MFVLVPGFIFILLKRCTHSIHNHKTFLPFPQAKNVMHTSNCSKNMKTVIVVDFTACGYTFPHNTTTHSASVVICRVFSALRLTVYT